jgi:osmotically inducible protein OsmC
MKRTASANWRGTGKEGKGTLSTQSHVLNKSPYAYVTRFENSPGTNPEELIAAAHAGCFSMKLSFNLTKEGFPPENIDTECEITLDPAKGEITESRLTVKAMVPGISNEKFKELVENAEKNCPVSKLLNAKISCDAKLIV